jgi:hypothetical protein
MQNNFLPPYYQSVYATLTQPEQIAVLQSVLAVEQINQTNMLAQQTKSASDQAAKITAIQAALTALTPQS